MARPTAVFDTNVLFSAIGWPGIPRRCLELGRSGAIRAATCEQIIEELAGKLKAKLAFSDRQVLETTLYLLSFMSDVPVPGTMHGSCVDPKDDVIIECAVAAGASHLISGDKKHLLAMKQFQRIQIVSPARFEAIFAGNFP